MAKGQKRSNREKKKKPKSALKTKTVSVRASHAAGGELKIGVPSPRQLKKK